ncbi:DUF4367 domain-containing protein [Bacillus sp. es.036]|uniref:DUF4367 domain-containing protein n=1 Tax=Bacillus sp. es.036 TaxID=1761764 RepID=UPI000BF7A656|nr:DUF4367 domain-containing protein [Bacillus sp. es.036]PFG12341.1 uncharacterized protein DUF4367 [Bacillus sp. es.036]
MLKKILFITMVLIITAGCASNQPASENTEEENTTKDDVTTVLEQIFSGPDEELTQIYEEEKYEEVSTYYMDKFNSYFTEDYMESAMNNDLLNSFHRKAYGNGVEMAIGTINVVQSEDTATAYDFDIQVNVSNGQTADVSGRVNTNEEGKITQIRYMDPQSLPYAFDTATETEDGLFVYDRSRLVSRTGDEAYQPMFPTVMPFEVDGVEIKHESKDDSTITFVFHGETGEKMELMTVKNGEISSDQLETEEVSIGDQKGQYAGTEGETQRLIWTNGSITYELKGKIEGLSKEDLLTVAESFE